MQFERETLEAVVSARNIAVNAVAGASPEHMAKAAAAEGVLSGALGRLMAVVEAYPDLKATNNIAQLQEELSSTENRVAFARQAYNDTATMYNVTQCQFPTNLLVSIANAKEVELWEIEDESERAVPIVDLSMQ